MGCNISRTWEYSSYVKINYEISEDELTIINARLVIYPEIRIKFINDLFYDYLFLNKYFSKKKVLKKWEKLIEQKKDWNLVLKFKRI